MERADVKAGSVYTNKVALKALSLLPAGGKVGARHLEQLSSGSPYLSGLWATKHSVPISCPGQSYVLLNT